MVKSYGWWWWSVACEIILSSPGTLFPFPIPSPSRLTIISPRKWIGELEFRKKCLRTEDGFSPALRLNHEFYLGLKVADHLPASQILRLLRKPAALDHARPRKIHKERATNSGTEFQLYIRMDQG